LIILFTKIFYLFPNIMHIYLKDEISMVSNINFAQIHLRLDEIFSGKNDTFGQQNMLLFGDFLQVNIT
jgi:hypothetical protein